MCTKITKTIIVEGYSDNDCNRKIIDSLNYVSEGKEIDSQSYTFRKINLIKLIRDAIKACPTASLLEMKKFIDENGRNYE